MGVLSLRLPDYLHKQVRELAKQEGVSINQFITLAVAEKMSALVTEEASMGVHAHHHLGK
jgi:predicted HicB family RNase H-like nuclease